MVTEGLGLNFKYLQIHDIAINEIALTGIDRDHIIQLIGDTISGISEPIESLARLVLQKTQGNPLFVKEFLNALQQKSLLSYQPYRKKYKSGHWTWDLKLIEQAAVTDNIVDLMVDKIETLSDPARQTLQSAACIGNTFDLDHFALVRERQLTKHHTTSRRHW